jgi:prevent-host-death family protein
MKRAISAADANREFSSVLRRVRQGHSFVVTSHGRPVARIVPMASGELVANEARTMLFDRLRAAPALSIKKWTRDDLYEG